MHALHELWTCVQARREACGPFPGSPAVGLPVGVGQAVRGPGLPAAQDHLVRSVPGSMRKTHEGMVLWCGTHMCGAITCASVLTRACSTIPACLEKPQMVECSRLCACARGVPCRLCAPQDFDAQGLVHLVWSVALLSLSPQGNVETPPREYTDALPHRHTPVRQH